MRRYSPSDLPVACWDCGGRIAYDAERYAWRHQQRPEDGHAPRPVGSEQAREAEARRKAVAR